MRIEVLMAVAIKIRPIVYDITPCSLIGVYRRLGAIYCLHFQGWSKHAASLLRLLFGHKNGRSRPTFLRNVRVLSPSYMASHPEVSTLHNDVLTAEFPYAQHESTWPAAMRRFSLRCGPQSMSRDHTALVVPLIPNYEFHSPDFL
jgi:hypothetical protein